jgi:predicted nuclease of restriction endonuclease-like (RecB) superfamily
MGNNLTFDMLVDSIQEIHKQLTAQAGQAVNVCLTLRNWLIGLYISDYELKGADRAEYGEKLLAELSCKLKELNVSSTGRRQLYNYLAFYRTFPEIMQTLPAQLGIRIKDIQRPPEKVRTVSAQLTIPPKKLVERLSYSHLELLIGIDDTLKRTFYQIECIKGNWSVRELKRQIASLYYERSGLSKNKKKLAEIVKSDAQQAEPKLAIRDPYIFEFLGLRPEEVMSESDLEDFLLDKLQDFLQELGHGFCFEARQKRILIGGEYFFVDLVFYHRILKCHVLIELKEEKFTHEHLGQLNTYLSWYKKNEMFEGDSPPVGILLCTQKNRTLVEYALAGIDNNLFVSRYQLVLPKKEEMQRFLEEQMKEHG